jgi:hypothetical protein
MDKEGIIELKISVKDYSKYFLSQNPFPAVGVPEEYPKITVDRDAIKKRFQNVISEILSTDRTIITVMVGEYGSGKSHLLKVFRNSINAQLLSGEAPTLAVYVKSPGEEFSDFFFSMIDSMGKELLSAQCRQFLAKEIYSKVGYRDFIFDAKVRDQYSKGKASLEDILVKSETNALFRRIHVECFKDIKNADVVFAFLNLARVKMSTKAWRWFLGQHLDRGDVGENGLDIEQQITSDNAYQMFLDFIKILHVTGIKYLAILIDELEKITLLSSAKRAKYQDQLRQMIDDNPKCMCLYFSISPREWDALTKETTALVRRLSANWHILEDFKTPDTRELIEAYVSSSRTDDYSAEKILKISPKFVPSLYPFTEEAVSAIVKASGGVVSAILVLARRCLETLPDRSKEFQVITAELVELVEKEIKKGMT